MIAVFSQISRVLPYAAAMLRSLAGLLWPCLQAGRFAKGGLNPAGSLQFFFGVAVIQGRGYQAGQAKNGLADEHYRQ